MGETYVNFPRHRSTSDSFLVVEQFEEDDDPEAGLDESSSSAYVRGEIWFPTGMQLYGHPFSHKILMIFY